MHSAFPIVDFAIPRLLSEIPDPPSKLYLRGTFPSEQNTFLAVVGSRNYTPYGKQVCEDLIKGLRGYPVVIVSGLALGIDGIAHRAALDAGLTTVAIPGSGLDEAVLYPRIHRALAEDILKSGGALVSEFEPYWKPRPESFPQRNRIMAGVSHAVLVVEAELRSGTLITSRIATEYNRDVFAVPGPITSKTSQGPHILIQKGAALIQSSEDILSALSLKSHNPTIQLPLNLNPQEQAVFSALSSPLPREHLIKKLNIPVSEFNVLISSLELKGYITERLGNIEWMKP